MDKGIGYEIDYLSPFDIPTDEENKLFILGENSVHLSSRVEKSKKHNCNYVSREFGIYLDLIIERGAIRNLDYIITANGNSLGWYVQIHTTDEFITKEDGMKYVQ